MNNSNNAKIKRELRSDDNNFVRQNNVKIFPLKDKPAFDLNDFKDWDIRVGDYESDSEVYSVKGETMMKIMKVIGIIIGIVALGAFFFYALMMVGTL